jgi:hypothetical protein
MQPAPLTIRLSVFAVVISLAGPRNGSAEQLRPETVQVWDSYVAAARGRIENRLAMQEPPFLWTDEDPVRGRRVREGEIVVAPSGKPNPKAIPHGLIHHWVGAVFVAHATLDQVLHVVHGYERYAEIYRPNIVRPRLLRDGDREQAFAMELVGKEFGVTAAIDADMDVEIRRLDDTHAHMYFSATRVQAIEAFGTPEERMDEVDSGPGYIWRLDMAWRVAERDDGAYIEMEAMALSRGIPLAVRWLVERLTNRLPRELIARILGATRDAALQEGVIRADGLSNRTVTEAIAGPGHPAHEGLLP